MMKGNQKNIKDRLRKLLLGNVTLNFDLTCWRWQSVVWVKNKQVYPSHKKIKIYIYAGQNIPISNDRENKMDKKNYSSSWDHSLQGTCILLIQHLTSGLYIRYKLKKCINVRGHEFNITCTKVTDTLCIMQGKNCTYKSFANKNKSPYFQYHL